MRASSVGGERATRREKLGVSVEPAGFARRAAAPADQIARSIAHQDTARGGAARLRAGISGFGRRGRWPRVGREGLDLSLGGARPTASQWDATSRDEQRQAPPRPG
jgi:hypothetical protein